MAVKKYIATQGAWTGGRYYAPGEIVSIEESRKSKTFVEVAEPTPPPPPPAAPQMQPQVKK